MVFGCRWSIIDFNFYKVCELIEENTEFESSHSAESMSVSETDSDEEQIFQIDSLLKAIWSNVNLKPVKFYLNTDTSPVTQT